MAVGDLTLTLGAISTVSNDFTVYVPRIAIAEHRSSVGYTTALNPLIRQPVAEGKYQWEYTAVGSYTDLYIPYSKLLQAQRTAIAAGTFAGITLTDEIDPYIEDAIAPTRLKVGAITDIGDSCISYSAVFLVGLSVDWERTANLYRAKTILVELGRPIVLSISATDASQNEGLSGTRSFTFTVTRDDTQLTNAVNWAVTGSGTFPANATDFSGGVLPSGTLTFTAGQTSKVITVLVQGDATVENTETFTVTLSGATGGAIISQATAIGTILDDDTPQVYNVSTSLGKAISLATDGNIAYSLTLGNGDRLLLFSGSKLLIIS